VPLLGPQLPSPSQVVGGWCFPLPWSSQWWWVGGAPRRRRCHCGGPRCRHHHRWWVVPPVAMVVTVGCRHHRRWWVVPPIAVVVIVVMVVGRCLLMPSSLWCPHCGGPIGGASSLVASDSEQNGVGWGTHLCCPQCPCCGGPAGDGASSLVAGGGCE